MTYHKNIICGRKAYIQYVFCILASVDRDLTTEVMIEGMRHVTTVQAREV